MLGWLFNTLLLATPFLAPVLILMIARARGYAWPAQRRLVRAALVFYALGLAAFAAEAWQSGQSGLFFQAYYGQMPDGPTTLVRAGYGMLCLAIISLMFAVNWKTVRLFRGLADRRPTDSK